MFEGGWGRLGEGRTGPQMLGSGAERAVKSGREFVQGTSELGETSGLVAER